MDLVLRERHGRVLVIRMNRPHKRNAIDPALTAALDTALDDFEDDPDLWVAVLTGGPEMFSAGTDLSTGSGEPTERGGEYGVVRRQRRKPLIAAVEGRALGGGMEIVLACDLVVASRTAAFGLPEPRRGVIALCGGLFRTHRALPLNVAKEILLTGDPIDAKRGFQLGFVNQVTEEGAAVDAAVALARRICRNAPTSVRESLVALERMNSADDERAWRITREAVVAVLTSQDTVEGVSAFFERREPRWLGQ
ncbi:enoyl-CoA hydratase/isomerase family protein [Nocardia sp. 2]|uniref:Enoyl-CoA hydratase/isomerase family protein n=1 Tax=Nocardia acididurans TaxID=2802282 RepID=A0ABS1MFN2_9NOCA|nr:enoyl-CoA hydratase-related protein [Nocardia acididurans]MBL1079427.1 enoyl-CoA hydratase/isomerase family protein [Nocardia acididurans]